MQTKTTNLILLFAVITLGPVRSRAQAETVTFARQADTIDVLDRREALYDLPFRYPHGQSLSATSADAHGIIVTRGFPVGDTIPPGQEHDDSLDRTNAPCTLGTVALGASTSGEKKYSRSTMGQMKNRVMGEWCSARLMRSKAAPTRVPFAPPSIWSGDHKPIGEETQQFTFSGDPDSRVIDCEFVLRADHGPLKIGDTKEGTFAIRVAPELDAPKGHMVNSEGGEGEPQIWGKRANWVDYDGVIDGQTLGIAIFDSPQSFRHPTYWHARGYGLFAANPFGLKEFTHDQTQDGSYTIPDKHRCGFAIVY